MTTTEKIEVFFVDIGGVLLDHNGAQNAFNEKVAKVAKLPLETVESLYEDGLLKYWHELECGRILPFQLYLRYWMVLQNVLYSGEWGRVRQVFTYAYFREAFGNVFRPKHEAIDFFKSLRTKRGQKIILVSNNNPIHYDYCLRTAPQIFQNADDCVLSQEVGYRKPDLEIWKIALEWGAFLQGGILKPESVFAVDDRPENIASARALGINGAVFTSVGNLKKELCLFGF